MRVVKTLEGLGIRSLDLKEVLSMCDSATYVPLSEEELKRAKELMHPEMHNDEQVFAALVGSSPNKQGGVTMVSTSKYSIPQFPEWVQARLLGEKSSRKAVTVPHCFGSLPCGCKRRVEQDGLNDVLDVWHLEFRDRDRLELPVGTFMHRECEKTFAINGRGTGELKLPINEISVTRNTGDLSPYHALPEEEDPLPPSRVTLAGIASKK